MSTPSDHPKLLLCDKVSSSTPLCHHYTIHQLHHYLGFHTLKSWEQLLNIGQDVFDLALNLGDTPLELGDVAIIKSSHFTCTPISWPANFLDAIHMDISFTDTDCQSVGGAKYILLLVDWATCYIWIYALCSVTHKDIIAALEEFAVDAGAPPH